MNLARSLSAFAVGASMVLVSGVDCGTSPSPSSSPGPKLSAAELSFNAMLSGKPDSATLVGGSQLSATVSQADLTHLLNVQWAQLTPQQIANDPVIVNALSAVPTLGQACAEKPWLTIGVAHADNCVADALASLGKGLSAIQNSTLLSSVASTWSCQVALASATTGVGAAVFGAACVYSVFGLLTSAYLDYRNGGGQSIVAMLQGCLKFDPSQHTCCNAGSASAIVSGIDLGGGVAYANSYTCCGITTDGTCSSIVGDGSPLTVRNPCNGQSVQVCEVPGADSANPNAHGCFPGNGN